LKQGFNFLKPQVEPPSVWTKVYDWVVSTARVILIIAEIAVIIALGVRIVIDIQGKQLDEQIKNLQSLMDIRKDEETKYRTLQSHVQGFATAWTNTPSYAAILVAVNKELPLSATNIQVSINTNTVSISGYALSSELNVMEKDLKTSPLFTKSTLSRLEVASQTAGNIGVGFAKFSFDTTIVNLDMRVLPTPTAEVTDTPQPGVTDQVQN
jgi:Tfp pilus assembly protein PilN